MKLPFDREELARAAIELCRDELRDRLMTFKETPLGQVTSRVGKRIIAAHNEGRKLDENDIIEICDEYAAVVMQGEDDA